MKEDKKVAILLSTYNGEKYVKEQIDSLLNQTYKNIQIYIRDDGSKDNTVKILEEYGNKINLVVGKNKGFMKSFFELLTYCSDANYYAYCDQDDVWFENKIENSIKMLEEKNKDVPLLYAGNFDYYDSNMKFIEHSKYKTKKPSFRNSIVECVAPGMTMCINKKARDEIVNNIPEKCLFHDWWTYMICSGLGETIYDNTVSVKYRRHSNNVTSECMNFFELQIWRIKTFILGKHFKDVKEQLIIFNNIYGKKLKEEDRRLLELFIEKNSITNIIKKVFYKKRYRANIIDDLLIRVMFLIGKM